MCILKLLFRIIRKTEGVTFSEWLGFLKTVREKGPGCEEFCRLTESFPSGGKTLSSADGNHLLALEMESFINVRISASLETFQKNIRQGLNENDETLVEAAFHRLKTDLKACLFFETMEDFPADLSSALSGQVTQLISGWQREYGNVLKERFGTFPAGSLGEEVLWYYFSHQPLNMIRPGQQEYKEKQCRTQHLSNRN